MDEKEFVEFAKEIGKLKKIKRTGWISHGKIKDPESVAEHTFRTAILGMLVAKEMGLDVDRVVKMCLIHDLEEIVTGDILTIRKVKMDKENIRRIEEDGIKKLLEILSPKLRDYFYELWKEHEEEKTKEAKLVKIIDGLEMMMQAKEYGKEFPENKKDLEGFWGELSPKLKFLEKDKFAKKILDYLRKVY